MCGRFERPHLVQVAGEAMVRGEGRLHAAAFPGVLSQEVRDHLAKTPLFIRKSSRHISGKCAITG